MKHYVSTAVMAAAFFVGISLLLYPAISDHINAIHQSKVIQSYDAATSQLSDADYEEIFDSARAYNETLAGTEGAFYFPDRVPGYLETLDITGTGIMGYVTIDKIGVELPVYHTVEADVLQGAVGHLPGTSLPIGGEGTHAVLSGHRGLPSARLFTDLDRLEPGDTFYLHILDRVLAYRVDQILPMVAKNDYAALKEAMQIIPGEDHVTLFTCTPYGINSHRLLVRGIRTEYLGEEDPVGEVLAESMVRFVPAEGAYRLLLLSALSLAGVLIAGLLRKKRRSRP